MVEYFDAKHAREMSDLYRISKYERELDSIYKRISLAVQNGDYEITLDYLSIPCGLLNELRKKGYKIKEFHGDQRDPRYIINISW